MSEINFCPIKGGKWYQIMESAMKTHAATAAWYENKGNPIWQNTEGKPSRLWAELVQHPQISDKYHALEILANRYTEDFIGKVTAKTIKLQEDGEVKLSDFLEYVSNKTEKEIQLGFAKRFGLLNPKNPEEVRSWPAEGISDKTYASILVRKNRINATARDVRAEVVKIPKNNTIHYTIKFTSTNAFTTKDGELSAFYDPTSGEITLTKKGLTPETVIHEFSHPFIDALTQHNPELFSNLIAEIKKDKSVPEIKAILDHVERHYAEADPNTRDKEILAYVLSEYGKGNIDINTGTNTKSAIQRFFDWVSKLTQDLVDQMKSGGTLYVGQIHPKTKYKEVADLFTVFSEVGTINLGAMAPQLKKIAPETTTEAKDSKREAMMAKMAEIRAKKGLGPIPPAHKMIESTPSNFVDIKDEAAHMASLLPKAITTNLVEGYLKVLSGGRKVVGMFENAMISLSSKGPKGTAYHEGFHAVFRTLLNTEEQATVIAEARKMYPLPLDKDIFDAVLEHGITEKEAEQLYYEEQLADSFSEFMETPNARPYSTGIKGFFQKLADWLTNVFTNKNTVDKLFKNVALGKYTKVTPNVVRGVAYKVHPTFNIHEVRQITRELASVAFKDVRSIDDLKVSTINMSEITEALMDGAVDAMERGDTEIADRIYDMLDETGEALDLFWLREIDFYLRNSLGLNPVMAKKAKTGEDSSVKEDADERDMEEKERSDFARTSYEVSGKENAAAAVKFLIAMTPQTQLVNVNAKATADNITNVLSPYTGLPVLVDFASVYNNLENLLAGTVATSANGNSQDAFENMLTTLRKHTRHKPELIEVISKLESSDHSVQTQFFTTFSRNKGSFMHHQIRGNANSGTIMSQFTASNFGSKATIIKDNWVYAFNAKFGINVGGQRVYNENKVADFTIARETLLNNLVTATIQQEATGEPINPAILTQFQDLLATMGIRLNPNTLNFMVEENMKEGFEDYNTNYAISLGEIITEFENATLDMAGKSGAIYGSNNIIEDNRRFFQQMLAESDAYFKTIPGENAFAGPGGNTIYTFQNNDSVSKAIALFKAGDLTHLQDIVESVYGKHSVWTKELLDPTNGEAAREAFVTQMYGNLRSEATAGDVGAKASELKPVDAYMDVVNKQLAGFFIGLAEADKARQTYFQGPKLRNSGVTQNTSGDLVMQSKGEGMTILKGYLADELSRMTTAHDVVVNNAAEEKDWVLNYHYYQVAEGTGEFGEKMDKIKGNAFYSFLFPAMNLAKAGLIDDTGRPLARGEENFWSNPRIEQYIRTHFTNLVKSEIDYAVEIGLLNRDKQGELSNRLISSTVIEDTKRKYKQGDQVDFTRIMADYVLNSIIGNIEQTKLFNGDPANYKVGAVPKSYAKNPTASGLISNWNTLNLFADFMKRVPAIFASGKDFRVFNDKSGAPIVRSHYTSATVANVMVPSSVFGERTEEGAVTFNEENLKEIHEATKIPIEELKELFEPYLNINQTDAQAWITLDAYKERMNGLGEWTTAHEEAYNKAISDVPMSPRDIKLLAQPLKTVHSELVKSQNNEMIMHYNKQSEAVLLPFMKNLSIGGLMASMEKDGIDHVIVLDGKKSGASGIVDMTDGKGTMLPGTEIKLNAVQLSYSNLFLQQELRAKGVKDNLLGSQVTKNVLAVLRLKAKYFKGLNGQEVLALHHSTIGRLSDMGLIDADAKLGYDPVTGKFESEMDPNAPSKVHQVVAESFEGELSENNIEALAEGAPMDALPIKNKIENKLLNYITKKTVKLKQQGGSLIQLSNLGMIGSEVKMSDAVKNGIIWLKNPTQELKPMRLEKGKTKAAQILMPHSKMMEMFSGTSKKAIAAQDALEAKFGTRNFKELSSVQLRTLIDSRILEGLSYRIPNQGPSSNDAFEIVGILPPEMGDTMIAFSDITIKTGSDFDIDKAFVILPNFYFSEKEGKIKKVGYNLAKLDTASKQSLENLRLDLMREMLLHPEAYADVMSPLDESWLSDLAGKLFPENIASKPMAFFTGRHQLSIKQLFDGAKSLVGVVANHMTHNSLVRAEDLSFKDYYLGVGQQRNGETLISNTVDVDGVSIAKTLVAYMNAIVDAAKDPFIARANINMHTASTAFMLARTGTSREWTTSFIGQPILKDLVEATEAAEGRFKNTSKSVKQNKYLSPVEVVLEKYGLNITEQSFKKDKTFKSMRANSTASINTTTEALQSAILNPEMDNPTFVQGQLKVLKQFLEWKGKASILNDVIKVGKADVEGATKNLITARLASNLFYKVLQDGAINNLESFFGVEVDPETQEVSFLTGDKGKLVGRYFENSVEAALDRFSRFFISGSNSMQRFVENIANNAGYRSLTTSTALEKLVTTISNEGYAAVASNSRAFYMSPEALHTMLYGKPVTTTTPAVLSLARRLQNAKKGEFANNLLIEGLQFRDGKDGAPVKVFLSNTEVIKETKEVLFDAWDQLLSSTNHEIKQLAEDLIRYSFYTSGFSKSVGDFYEHIPNSWLKNNGFHDDMRAKNKELDEYSALNEYEDKVYKNLYKDDTIVPKVRPDSMKFIHWSRGSDLILEKEHGFVLTEHDSYSYTIGTGPDGKVFKPYLKQENVFTDQSTQEIIKSYLLFKLAGYTPAGNAVYLRTNMLGINGGGNNIKEYNGDGNSSIFAKNNVSLPAGVEKLYSSLAQRSNLVHSAYETNEFHSDPEGEIEDRAKFCFIN